MDVSDEEAVPRPTTKTIERPNRRSLPPDLIATRGTAPVVRRGYRIGVPAGGAYEEILNSDADVYGGSNVGNQGLVHAENARAHGYEFSLNLSVPPLGFLLLKANKE